MFVSNYLKAALVLCSLVMASGSYWALAQSLGGMEEHHRRFNPQHAGYEGKEFPAPNHPREVWRSKYGAIAADFTGFGKGAGAAEDENSMRAARRVAMQRCGTRGCKVIATVANGCLAGVHGGGYTAVGGGATRDEAIDVALSQCRPADGSRCELYYAYCSLPVRIR